MTERAPTGGSVRHDATATAGSRKPPLTRIGWRERVSLPGLGVPTIVAKIDTGARSSAICARAIAEFERDGAAWVRFEICADRRRDKAIRCAAAVADMRSIRNSGGQSERRYIVVTDLMMRSARWPIEIGLTDRGEMLYPLLLGRTALRRRVIIDPGRSFLIGPAPPA